MFATNPSRRDVIQSFGIAAAGLALCGTRGDTLGAEQRNIGSAGSLVLPFMTWTHVELNDFLNALPRDAFVGLGNALVFDRNESEPKYSIDNICDDIGDEIRWARKQLLWVSSDLVAYPFKGDETKIPYHDIVKWVAKEVGIDEWVRNTQPTFLLERLIQEQLFKSIWDKLDQVQRAGLLVNIEKIDPTNAIKNKAGIALLTGAGALAALATTVYFSGFSFYMAMATTLCTVAGFVGITLPFAVFTASAQIVAFLCGPVGWIIDAILVALAITILGKANKQQTAAFIFQMHSLKVSALKSSGDNKDEYYRGIGNPFRRQFVGNWQIDTPEHLVDLKLIGDGTFTATETQKRGPKDNKSMPWECHGHWSMNDDRLTVTVDKYRASGSRSWNDTEEIWFDEARPKKITELEIEFTNGQKLSRQ